VQTDSSSVWLPTHFEIHSRIRINDDNAVLWGLRDRCSVLGKSLRYFTSFDFGIIDVEIPCSDSTHAAWAYTTLTRHVTRTLCLA